MNNRNVVSFLRGLVGLISVCVIITTALGQTVDGFTPTVTTETWDGFILYTAVPLVDGEVLAGGSNATFPYGLSDFGTSLSITNLVHLESDGAVDASFQTSDQEDGFNGDGDGYLCVAVTTNGQIIVGGEFTTLDGHGCYGLGRLNVDGSFDSTFSRCPFLHPIDCVQVQPDGKVLVCGWETPLTRLKSDGSRDSSLLDSISGNTGTMALQPDGKILVGGQFTEIDDQARTNLVRLNADGSVDSSFMGHSWGAVEWAGGLTAVQALLVQPDGKILVGGNFNQVDGLVHTNIVRLNADGTVDPAFNAQLDAAGCWGVYGLAMQADGKIILGDDSATLNGMPCVAVGRLNPDGSIDQGFATNVFSRSDAEGIFSVALQPDGALLLTGFFSTVCGQPRSGIGRLINTDAAIEGFAYDGTNLFWQRGGTGPEVWRTTFENSVDGIAWTYLGDGTRVAGGWQLTNVFVASNSILRARGFVTGGYRNGSSYYVESRCRLPVPKIVCNGAGFGMTNLAFGFDISGGASTTVVVDRSTNLYNWAPVSTNTLDQKGSHFCDATTTNSGSGPQFYRLRLQP